jgi:ketosteroid isomerase-like protein
MKRILTTGLALGLAASFAAPTIAAASAAQDRSTEKKKKAHAAVLATLTQLASADASGDAVLAARQFDGNANLMPPGGPPIRGRDEIEKLYRAMSATAVRKISIDSEEMWIMDDWAASRGVIRGEATYRDGKGTRPVNDKYLMMLQRSGDRWEIVSLAWNPF